MPKLGLKLGAEAAKVEATEGFANYTGPTPPAGVYPAVIKQIGVGTTKETKKDMLRAIVEFKAPEGDPRHKYNGYAIFHYLVIPDSESDEHYGLQVGQINRMLDAMSNKDQAVRNALWGGKADTDAAGKKITKIGKIDLTGKDGIPVLVSAKEETYRRKVMKGGKPVKENGKEVFEDSISLRVNDFFPAKDERGKIELTDEQQDAVGYNEPLEDEGNDGFVEETDLGSLDSDADGGLDDSGDSADDTDWDAAAAEELSEDTEDAAAEEDDDDSADLIAQEIPDEEEEQKMVEPEKPARRRRSAF